MNQHQFESLVLYASDHLWEPTHTHDDEPQIPRFRFNACSTLLHILGHHLGYSNDIYAWSAAIRDIEDRWRDDEIQHDIKQHNTTQYQESTLLLADPVKGPFYISRILDSIRNPHRRYVNVFTELGHLDTDRIIFPLYTVTNYTVLTLACAKQWLRDNGRDGYRYLVHRDKLDDQYWWTDRVQHDPQQVVATFTILNGEPYRVQTQTGLVA